MSSLEFNLENFEILNVSVKLKNGEIRNFDVADELAVNEEELNEDFIKQSGKYAWWAVLAEHADAYAKDLKAELERVEAEADGRARKSLEAEGLKITEGAVEKWVKKDLTYVDAVARYNKAQKNAKILDKIVRAFDHRREMLINLGALKRRDWEGSEELSLREKAEKAKEITRR